MEHSESPPEAEPVPVLHCAGGTVPQNSVRPLLLCAGAQQAVILLLGVMMLDGGMFLKLSFLTAACYCVFAAYILRRSRRGLSRPDRFFLAAGPTVLMMFACIALYFTL